MAERKVKFNAETLKNRIPVWIALSELYLDTEINENTLKYIANEIKKSSYTIQEVLDINKYEVFPVLYSNLISVVGIWDMFDEEWLVNSILKSYKKNVFFRAKSAFLYFLFNKNIDNRIKKLLQYVDYNN